MMNQNRIESGALGVDGPEAAPLLLDPLEQARALWRFRWQILFCCIFSVTAAVLAVNAATPLYRATATVMIEAKTLNVTNIKQVSEENPWAFDQYQQSQHEILRSRLVAAAVYSALQLDQNPEFSAQASEAGQPAPSGLLTEAMGFARNVMQKLSGRAESEAPAGPPDGIAILQGHITVDPVPNTSLVKVNGIDKDPAMAEKIANAVVNAYLQTERNSRMGVSEQASDFLDQRLEELKERLKQSEAALQKFFESEKLLNVGGGRGLVEEELTDNNRRLRQARETRTDLENVYQKILAARGNLQALQEIPVIQQEPLVQSTKGSLLQAQQQAGELEARYGEKHPRMVELRAKLKEAQAAYDRQLQLAADGVKSKYEVARDTEKSLAGLVEQSRGQIQGLDRKQYELQLLQQEVKSNRDLVDSFLTRYKETDAAKQLDIGNIRVIDRAVVPGKPFRPRKMLWLLTAGMFGLFFGMMLALLRAYLDQSIKDPPELERVTGLPVLATLPILKESKTQIARAELDEPNSMFAEGIRSLRTAIALSDVPTRKQIILVTSATPSEGKSSLVANLGLAFGQVEDTLIIEADLRKPSLTEYLGLENGSSGLTGVVTGQHAPGEHVLRKLSGSRTDLLPCGTRPPNPLELISAPQFEAMLKALAARYTRIIIDSPPVAVVSDALVLSRYADCVILLAKADGVHRRAVAHAARQLRQAGAKLLGSVLNQASQPRRGYGSGYYYYYDKGYYGSERPRKAAGA